MNDTDSTFSAYSLKMANYLCSKGHKIVGIIDSPSDPTGRIKNVLFRRSERLEMDIKKFYKEERMKKDMEA